MPFWRQPTMSYSLSIRHVHCCSNEKKTTFKRSDDFVAFIFLHLCCYLLSTKYTRLSRPQLIEQVSYLEWIEVPPPSTKSTLPLNFVETVWFRHAWVIPIELFLSIEQWSINKIKACNKKKNLKMTHTRNSATC